MTEVAFHFGAPDKVAYSCRLLRKAVNAGAKVTVAADAQVQLRLDAGLWALSPTDFVAHSCEGSPACVEAMSPVWLTSVLQGSGVQGRVLVNLFDAIPAGVENYTRIIEVVSSDEADRVLARKRWKLYVERGFQIVRHDLTVSGEGT